MGIVAWICDKLGCYNDCEKEIDELSAEKDGIMHELSNCNSTLDSKARLLADCILSKTQLAEQLTNCQSQATTYQSQMKGLEDEKSFLEERIDYLTKPHPFDLEYPRTKMIYRNKRYVTDIYNQKVFLDYDLREFIYGDDYYMQYLHDEITSVYKPNTEEQDVRAVMAYICQNVVKYEFDSYLHGGVEDFWQFPEETYALGKGDSTMDYEEIYTKDGIKKVGDLKLGDVVLSYNFNEKKYEYKPIINIWDRGMKQINRVHLRNGQFVDVSEKHHFWMRTSQDKGMEYQKQDLCDVDLTRWWKRKTPIAKQIPYEIKDIEWLTEGLCFVIGHYVAEGSKSKSKSHIETSGYNSYLVTEQLEKNNIPFSEGQNGCGVPIVNILKSEFKEYLKTIKENSFDIHLPEELFHLPPNKLKALWDGMFSGDGHYPTNTLPNMKRDWCYSTSSEQLARDIQRIHLQLGTSLHIWKQMNHQGAGKQPIYRITHNPNSNFLQDFGYDSISEVSISWIEKLEEAHAMDFEVEDNHSFVFKNGIIGHQCEDGSILVASLLRTFVEPARVRVILGMYQQKYGHSWVEYHDGIEWKLLESTMPFKYTNQLESVINKPDYKKYYAFNDKFCWTICDDLSFGETLDNLMSEESRKAQHEMGQQVI